MQSRASRLGIGQARVNLYRIYRFCSREVLAEREGAGATELTNAAASRLTLFYKLPRCLQSRRKVHPAGRIYFFFASAFFSFGGAASGTTRSTCVPSSAR